MALMALLLLLFAFEVSHCSFMLPTFNCEGVCVYDAIDLSRFKKVSYHPEGTKLKIHLASTLY